MTSYDYLFAMSLGIGGSARTGNSHIADSCKGVMLLRAPSNLFSYNFLLIDFNCASVKKASTFCFRSLVRNLNSSARNRPTFRDMTQKVLIYQTLWHQKSETRIFIFRAVRISKLMSITQASSTQSTNM